MSVYRRGKTWWYSFVFWRAVHPGKCQDLPRGRGRFDATQPAASFKTAWQRLRGRARVSVRFHDLRHTLITNLCEAGAGDETIMAIAGHGSRRMLERYAHIRTEAKRRALESSPSGRADAVFPGV